MTDQEQARTAAPFLTYGVITLIALVIYILSPGPVIFVLQLMFDRPPSWFHAFFETIYTPIILMIDNVEWFKAIFMWYLNLWGVR